MTKAAVVSSSSSLPNVFFLSKHFCSLKKKTPCHFHHSVYIHYCLVVSVSDL